MDVRSGGSLQKLSFLERAVPCPWTPQRPAEGLAPRILLHLFTRLSCSRPWRRFQILKRSFLVFQVCPRSSQTQMFRGFWGSSCESS